MERKEIYRKALFRYGIIPITLILQEYEEKEDFEECKMILDVINETNLGLPTKYNEETLMEVKKEFQKFGLKGDIFIHNVPFYVQEIKKMTNPQH